MASPISYDLDPMYYMDQIKFLNLIPGFWDRVYFLRSNLQCVFFTIIFVLNVKDKIKIIISNFKIGTFNLR